MYIKSIAVVIAALGLTTTTMAQDNTELEDGSWVSLGGSIASTDANSFMLKTGDGSVEVDMQGWDWYSEGKDLKQGDEVIVYGQVDHDWFEDKTIEASSVFVSSLSTYFYANDADEDDAAYVTVTTPVVVGYADIVGTVQSVDDETFMMDTGKSTLTVNVSSMGENPLDDEGYQQLSEGDRVKVYGTMDYEVFETSEIMADAVVTLNQDNSKKVHSES